MALSIVPCALLIVLSAAVGVGAAALLIVYRVGGEIIAYGLEHGGATAGHKA